MPRPKTPGTKGLGKLHYVVEQTFALLHQFRRLAVRWERRLDIHDGLVSLDLLALLDQMDRPKIVLCRREYLNARPDRDHA
jgi:hypothetical protein